MVATSTTTGYRYTVEVEPADALSEWEQRKHATGTGRIWGRDAIATGYEPPDDPSGFAQLQRQLNALDDPAARPVDDECEPPNALSTWLAQIVLRVLEDIDFLPTRVVAVTDGGVGICFVHGQRYAELECFNSGEIVAGTSNRVDMPIVWSVQPHELRTSLARIRDALRP